MENSRRGAGNACPASYLLEQRTSLPLRLARIALTTLAAWVRSASPRRSALAVSSVRQSSARRVDGPSSAASPRPGASRVLGLAFSEPEARLRRLPASGTAKPARRLYHHMYAHQSRQKVSPLAVSAVFARRVRYASRLPHIIIVTPPISKPPHAQEQSTEQIAAPRTAE